MFEFLKELAAVMTRPRVTVEDMIGAVGEPSIDLESSLVIEPFSEYFSEAAIVRDHGPREPAYLRLQLARAIPLQQLAEAFGDYRTRGGSEEQT